MVYYDRKFRLLIPGMKVRLYDYNDDDNLGFLEGEIVDNPLKNNEIEILCNGGYIGNVYLTFNSVPLLAIEII